MGRAIIKKIQLRTLEGKDLDGKRFAPYSKSYSQSLDFKLAGKSPKAVDLRFTHEMMQGMTVLHSEVGSVTIGFISDAANKKAEWAQADDNGPARKFFGITPTELQAIVAQYAAPQDATRGLAESILRGLLGFGK